MKLQLLFILFLIPLVVGSEWCEYQQLETHQVNTSKGNWIDSESSTLTNNQGSWIFEAGCSRTQSNKCPLGVSDYCILCNPSNHANFTIPFNYCPNMTIQFDMKGDVSGEVFSMDLCDNVYEITTDSIPDKITLTNIFYQSCSNNILTLTSNSSDQNGFDNFNISCNFKNPPFSPPDNNIGEEFYAYPKMFTELGDGPNETYPNVTYKIRLNMTNYNPSCSDTDNLNKYSYLTLPNQFINPSDLSWLKQTTSCVEIDNQTLEQQHYSYSGFMLGGCKALVNYQNATLNCELIKYNTTVGEDTPTMNIFQPVNQTSIPLTNPVSFVANMSNNKCVDVYVISTNQETGYNKLTILYSSDGYYYTGSETLPNGTYSTDFICIDGCNSNNVTETIQFLVSTEYITGGGVIQYLNGTSCSSNWVNLGEKAFCYTPTIQIPSYCSDIEVKETTSIEFDNYITSCETDGGLFNDGRFNLTSCSPTSSCGYGDYYCNETSRTKSKTSTSYLSSQVATGYSEGYVPLDCGCPVNILSSWLGLSKRVNKFRVSGHLEMSCQGSCVGNWICSDTKTKAYMNTSCELEQITPCDYMCDNGVCITQTGETDTGQTTGLSGLYGLIYKPSPSQKMVMGFSGCIILGVLGLFLGKSFNESHKSLLFMIMFGVGFAIFTFIGFIPAILIVLIIFFSGVYVLSKVLM